MKRGDIAVIGGGINGVCIAWQFARAGYRVELFEAGNLMGKTSSASSKLLHGGLRYLEYGRIWSVREALIERAWWLAAAPELTRRIRLLLPIYRGTARPRFRIAIGLSLYDILAGKNNIGHHGWWSANTVQDCHPELQQIGLRGGYFFYDGQMNDRKLGLWAAEEARQAGAAITENAPVRTVSTKGDVELEDGQKSKYSIVVNATGPWASKLLERSSIESAIGIESVRGSHLLIKRTMTDGFCLQHPHDKRVFFVLPYEGTTLIGTTEVQQSIDEPVAADEAEIDYLLAGFNAYFRDGLTRRDIVETFAGVRPVVRHRGSATKATRDYRIEPIGRIINVWGGKWTTSRALARKVARLARRHLS